MGHESLRSIHIDEDLKLENEIHSPVLEIQEIPGLPKNFFNAAACRLEEDPGSPVLLLGRHVEGHNRPGEPDIGPLVMALLNHDSVETLTEVWRPEESGQGDLLEDPRLVRLPDGQLFMGFTRLALYQGRYLPFPAVSISSPERLLHGEFPHTQLITGLGSGDQTTPLGGGPNQLRVLSGKNAVPLKPNQAMFRREVDNHRFTVFSIDEEGIAQQLQYLEFPEGSIPFWGESRMGLTMPPIWLNENEALLLIHGFNITYGKFKYHIGTSRLFIDQTGNYAIDNISQQPLLAPEVFKDLFRGEEVERHPDERQALYLCGGSPIYDASGGLSLIDLYPSVGDTYTVKATISAPEVMKDWHRDELYMHTQSAA